MKKYASLDLLEQLQTETRQMILDANYLKTTDPGKLLQEHAAGKWSIIQILEHLNRYGNYYLLAI